MYKNVLRVLEGSKIGPRSHPVLCSLLQLAGQGPHLSGAGPGSFRVRLHRHWKRVEKAFRQCEAVGLTDRELRAAMPFPGLLFTDERGWEITERQVHKYRLLVEAALLQAVRVKGGGLRAFKIESLADLRAAQKANGIRSFTIGQVVEMRVISPILPGRRFIGIRRIDGAAVYSAMESDEFGRLRALIHECSKERALARCRRGVGK